MFTVVVAHWRLHHPLFTTLYHLTFCLLFVALKLLYCKERLQLRTALIICEVLSSVWSLIIPFRYFALQKVIWQLPPLWDTGKVYLLFMSILFHIQLHQRWQPRQFCLQLLSMSLNIYVIFFLILHNHTLLVFRVFDHYHVMRILKWRTVILSFDFFLFKTTSKFTNLTTACLLSATHTMPLNINIF